MWYWKRRQTSTDEKENRKIETEEDFTDKRRHKRYRLRDMAFAVVDRDPTLRAEIVDISTGGVAIRYRKENGTAIQPFQELDLLAPGFGFFYIGKIRASIVSDYQVIGKNTPESNETRRCGLRFENLTREQTTRLEAITRDYAIAS